MKDGPRVLLTGHNGQLGQALMAACPATVELIALGRNELDLADAEACRAAVREHRPDWLINAAAYTAVDRAEEEAEIARTVNAEAPGTLAAALRESGGRMLQIGTDFVFDGGQGHPYAPDQPVNPLGVYGATKAEGERRVLEQLGPERGCILRTSWVYGPLGKNFCLTMLGLHRRRAADDEALAVVADQVGCPTATHGLAAACWAAVQRGGGGILHWCDAGVASWYDFAVAIGELGTAAGLLERPAAVRPITTADYPTPARRPAYSLLDCSGSRRRLGLEASHWRHALAEVLARLARAGSPAG